MKFDRPLFILSGLVIVAAFLTGCGRSEKSSGADSARRTDEPYRVLCTVGMITDIVRNIAGDYAQVEGIIGEGVDPHLYKPTRSDVVNLSTADVVFYNGLLLEGKMTNVLVGSQALVSRSGR